MDVGQDSDHVGLSKTSIGNYTKNIVRNASDIHVSLSIRIVFNNELHLRVLDVIISSRFVNTNLSVFYLFCLPYTRYM